MMSQPYANKGLRTSVVARAMLGLCLGTLTVLRSGWFEGFFVYLVYGLSICTAAHHFNLGWWANEREAALWREFDRSSSAGGPDGALTIDQPTDDDGPL